MMERLDKFLAAQGKGTRKEVGRLIRSGAVAVDGVPVRVPAAKVDPSRQTVAVGGNPILWQEHLYIMMNKPAGVLSATEDRRQKTVLDLLPEDLRRRGLALSCGARLILTCLDQGLLPSWDAHDRRSAALAEKLGYRLDRPYPAYLLDQTGP